MKSSLIVEISRRATRALDLGKGMFFDADAMAVLAGCGALDAMQSAASEYLKERASERLEARHSAQRSAARRNAPPAQRTFQPRQAPRLQLVDSEPVRGEPNSNVSESFKRALRMLEKPKRK